MSAQMIAYVVYVYGLMGLVLVVFSVWVVIAIRDKNSWARKLFEAIPKGLVLAIEHLGSRVSKRIKQVSNPKSSQRLKERDDFDDDEFWNDTFSLDLAQVKRYGKIVSTMPPT